VVSHVCDGEKGGVTRGEEATSLTLSVSRLGSPARDGHGRAGARPAGVSELAGGWSMGQLGRAAGRAPTWGGRLD